VIISRSIHGELIEARKKSPTKKISEQQGSHPSPRPPSSLGLGETVQSQSHERAFLASASLLSAPIDVGDENRNGSAEFVQAGIAKLGKGSIASARFIRPILPNRRNDACADDAPLSRNCYRGTHMASFRFCGLPIREKTMKKEATHAYISMVNAITYLLRQGEPAICKPSSQSIQRQDTVDQQNADAEQYDQQNLQDPFQNQRQHRISP